MFKGRMAQSIQTNFDTVRGFTCQSSTGVVDGKSRQLNVPLAREIYFGSGMSQEVETNY